ncbi:MAG: hypothetical protein KC503_13925 [Myxococcales bacterium]|nr:hypothetical protein [Myxococcales bacterium]
MAVIGCTAEVAGGLGDAGAGADVQTVWPDSRVPDTSPPPPPPPAPDGAAAADDGAATAADAGAAGGDAAASDSGADSTPPPSSFCPQLPNATVFSRAQAFTPTPAQPTATFDIPAAAGRAIASVSLRLSVTHGGWHPQAGGAHGIFQLTRSQKWGGNLFGFMTVRDKPSKLVRVISNVDLAPGETDRLQQTRLLAPGSTYALRFDYDVAAKQRRLQLVDGANNAVVDVVDDHVPTQC